MMETLRLGARLRAARKAAGFKTSKKFIIENNVPASTYSQHESGARVPDDATLKLYCKIFCVNFNWLKEGKGLPFSNSNCTPTKTVLEEELFDLNQFKQTSSLNANLLTLILGEVMSKHAEQMPAPTINNIVRDTIKTYEAAKSLNISEKNQMKSLINTLKNYKKG